MASTQRSCHERATDYTAARQFSVAVARTCDQTAATKAVEVLPAPKSFETFGAPSAPVSGATADMAVNGEGLVAVRRHVRRCQRATEPDAALVFLAASVDVVHPRPR